MEGMKVIKKTNVIAKRVLHGLIFRLLKGEQSRVKPVVLFFTEGIK